MAWALRTSRLLLLCLLGSAIAAADDAADAAACLPGSGQEACSSEAAAAAADDDVEDGLAAIQVRSRGSEGSDARRRRPSPLYVLTDMGFDDWGAFSVLHASGNDPDAILAVSGMENSSFTPDFARLLQSWGIDSPIYQGADGCHHDCLNTSFIELPYLENGPKTVSGWGYRDNVKTYYPDALNKPSAPATGKVEDGDFPWKSCVRGKYRLLILSPLSEFDYRLYKDPDLLKCIEEVVVSGSVFGDSEEGRKMAAQDFNTWKQLIPMGTGNYATINLLKLNQQFDQPATPSDSSTLRELNVVSDALAAARSLLTAASKGVKVTIIPIEVESIDRYGMQKILKDSPDAETVDPDLQASETNKYVEVLCNSGDVAKNNPTGGMVQSMACVRTKSYKDQNSQYPLDMDAIVATYIWAPQLFKFEQSLVAIDSTSGMTYSECRAVSKGMCQCSGTSKILDCGSVKRATGFCAMTWLKMINKDFLGGASR